MVQFLLHNSLGAWWQARHPDKRCPVNLTYLRHTEDGAPVAGGFEGWPDDLSEFRLLDPCCGSGHFLVAAFLMLVPMRMALEGVERDRCSQCRIARQPARAGTGPALRGYRRLRARDGSMALFLVQVATGRCPDSTLPGAASRSAVSGNNGRRCRGAIVELRSGWGCSTTLFRMRLCSVA